MKNNAMSRHETVFVFLFLLLLVGLFSDPPSSHGFTSVAGGETVTWDFQGIPATNLFGVGNSCVYKADTNYWICSYAMIDPPYGSQITFTASVTPTQGTYPALWFGYYDISDLVNQSNFQWIYSRTCVFPCAPPMALSTSFYIPARAGEFTLFYSSDGQGTGVTNIEMRFQIANYDPCRASLFGGDDINPDGNYCEEQTGPGKPRVRKFRNKRGTGPGS
jgi:hypothetical protein